MSENGIVKAEAKPQPIAMNGKGVHLASFEDAYRFAKAVASSGLAPKGMNEAAILVAIQMGAEVGLPPMASLQNIAVINGRPALWGDGMLALCQGHSSWDGSVFEEVLNGDGEKSEACCTVGRKGCKPVTRTFSVADAKKAGLWGKSGPWTQYPWRMLQMRARSFALRDCFADLLRGVRSVEEVRDIEAIPATESRAARLNATLAGEVVADQVQESTPVEVELDDGAEPAIVAEARSIFGGELEE